jgi:DNA-binding transcriptional LysR family regulator
MVLVHAGFRAKPQPGRALISIEANSATWRAIEPQLAARHPGLLARARIPVETFSAAVQMVRADFGDGLVPLGLALELSIEPACYRPIPCIRRRVSLVTRKTVNQLSEFTRLRERLAAVAARYFKS